MHRRRRAPAYNRTHTADRSARGNDDGWAAGRGRRVGGGESTAGRPDAAGAGLGGRPCHGSRAQRRAPSRPRARRSRSCASWGRQAVLAAQLISRPTGCRCARSGPSSATRSSGWSTACGRSSGFELHGRSALPRRGRPRRCAGCWRWPPTSGSCCASPRGCAALPRCTAAPPTRDRPQRPRCRAAGQLVGRAVQVELEIWRSVPRPGHLPRTRPPARGAACRARGQEAAMRRLRAELAAVGLRAEAGRLKHLYSIYSKMRSGARSTRSATCARCG